MKKIFDSLIDSYIENKIGISDDFLGAELAAHLKENLLKLFAEDQLKSAGTGLDAGLKFNQLIRSDQIFWLDPSHNDIHENEFFTLMDQFIAHLNATCYTGIKSYEFHYTLYSEGSFYKSHVDQFHHNDSRQFSMIMYLNEDWKIADGGELCIHYKDRDELISPTNGKSVFFKSNELMHEVLVTNKARMCNRLVEILGDHSPFKKETFLFKPSNFVRFTADPLKTFEKTSCVISSQSRFVISSNPV